MKGSHPGERGLVLCCTSIKLCYSKTAWHGRLIALGGGDAAAQPSPPPTRHTQMGKMTFLPVDRAKRLMFLPDAVEKSTQPAVTECGLGHVFSCLSKCTHPLLPMFSGRLMGVHTSKYECFSAVVN